MAAIKHNQTIEPSFNSKHGAKTDDVVIESEVLALFVVHRQCYGWFVWDREFFAQGVGVAITTVCVQAGMQLELFFSCFDGEDKIVFVDSTSRA